MNSYKVSAYRFLLAIVGALWLAGAYAQSGTWTWMGGNATYGSFGQRGVADSIHWPDAVYEAATWKDLGGNFWIFGGVDSVGETSDMWKYDPATSEWTWIMGPGGIAEQPGIYGTEGVPSPANIPGARAWGMHTWTDTSGDLWLYGGGGYDTTGNWGDFADVWKYHIATNEWTWLAGWPTVYNWPGADYGGLRQLSPNASPDGREEGGDDWVDKNDNLWFFGSLIYDWENNDWDSYNDMWMFSTSVNQWAWMGGDQNPNSNYHYGTEGVDDSSNLPPARGTYLRWKDNDDNFYIFGGLGIWNGSTNPTYSDIWKYNTATYDWTWIAGDSGINSRGSYNEYCVDHGRKGPEARYENRGAQITGCSPRFITFGGWDSLGGYHNDLWLFDLDSLQWHWLSGSAQHGDTGNFGMQGIPSVNSLPAARVGACTWCDALGNFWAFSGQTQRGTINDLWKYTPDPSCTSISSGISNSSFSLSALQLCSSSTDTLTLNAINNAVLTPDSNVSWPNSNTAIIPISNSVTFRLTGTDNCGGTVDTSFTISIVTGSIQITSNKSIICPSDSAQICAPAGYSSYVWSTRDTTSCITTDQAGNYYVTVTAPGGCSATSNHITINVYSTPPVSTSLLDDTLHAYNAVTYQWYLNDTLIPGATDSIFVIKQAGTYSVGITDTNGCAAMSNGLVVSGIANLQQQLSLKIYPDPAADELNISYILNESTTLQITLTDLTGRLIQNVLHEHEVSGTYLQEVNIAALASGVYMMNFVSERGSVALRFEKE